MRRESLSNPLLEPLTDVRRTQTQLSFLLTLLEEYSDNFERTDDSSDVEDSGNNLRSELSFGTIYRRERTRSFLSLANTIRATYDTIDQDFTFGFINLTLDTGYTWPRLSFALNDNLVIDDDRFLFTQGLESDRGRFLTNNFSPQMRYTLSPLSALTLRYQNTVVVNLEDNDFDSVTNSVTPGFEYRFSRAVQGSISYTFRSVDQGSEDVSADQGFEEEDELSHEVMATLGWLLSTRTNLLFRLQTLYIDQRPEEIDATIQVNAGFNQQLSPRWRLFVSAGPSYVSTSNRIGGVKNEDKRILGNWEISLDGQIASQTSIELRSSQYVENTSGELADQGLVLRTLVNLELNHTFTPALQSLFFIEFGRNDLLEESALEDPTQSREDLFIRTGLTGTYVFTRTLSLALTYQYEQRFSDNDEFDFQENRVTLALSSSF